MSGLLATVNPRRIKAAHRRRRKVASGQSVQRYYDPGIGRFLSVDPVTADANTGANFNRYKYASNNPYRFFDPDGRLDKERKDIERMDRRSILARSPGSAAQMATSARPLNAAKALSHYKAGSGTPLRVDFRSVNTSEVRPSDYKQVQGLIDGELNGARKIDDKLPFTTSGKDWALLGDITLRLQGTLKLDSSSYSFSGTLKSYDDVYNFNKSTHRGVIGEMLTRYGASQDGRPFSLEIRGVKQIEEAGSR